MQPSCYRNTPQWKQAGSGVAMSADFNFFQHWYPILPVADLVPDRPIAARLLGMPLAIWKPDEASSYRAFIDCCPHRLAPLSEGRIEGGQLECCYHGWRFDTNGACTAVPQAEDPQLLERHPERLQARVLPSCEANDLLWVWPDPDSPELAARTPLPLSPQIDTSQGFVWSSFVRDLAYDWQTLVENVADPSHVPFAHHGVQGDRNRASPLQVEIAESGPERIVAELKRSFPATITFEPPCRLEYATQLGNSGKRIGLITYCLPVAPGRSRIVAQFARNFAYRAHRLTPRWWEHVRTRNQVLDGDMILLHHQEAALGQADRWQSAYTMPTQADRLVVAFRQWFDRHCQGRLPWEAAGIEPSQPSIPEGRREVLLDRYRQHTQHCRSCQGALARIEQLQAAALAGAALLVVAIALLPDTYRLQAGLPLAAITSLCAAAWVGLKYRLEPQFRFVDYVHAER